MLMLVIGKNSMVDFSRGTENFALHFDPKLMSLKFHIQESRRYVLISVFVPLIVMLNLVLLDICGGWGMRGRDAVGRRSYLLAFAGGLGVRGRPDRIVCS